MINFVFSNSGGLIKVACIYNFKFAALQLEYSSSKEIAMFRIGSLNVPTLSQAQPLLETY